MVEGVSQARVPWCQWYGGLVCKWTLVLCSLLTLTTAARAQQSASAQPPAANEATTPKRASKRALSLEVASGVIVLGKGMTGLEAGLSLVDLGIAWVPVRYFVGRAAVGYAP